MKALSTIQLNQLIFSSYQLAHYSLKWIFSGSLKWAVPGLVRHFFELLEQGSSIDSRLKAFQPSNQSLPDKNQQVSHNPIEEKIHFFWVGSVLPDEYADNLLSFIRALPEKWTIYIWTTDPKCVLNAKYFKTLERLPSSVKIGHIQKLLDNGIPKAIPKKIALKINCIISQELTGLGNPAAAKDCCTPLILFNKGGYFFDFDSKVPKGKIFPPKEAKKGFLVINEGHPAAVAAKKGSSFCVDALINLEERYEMLRKEDNTCPQKAAFYPQELRDRNSNGRIAATGRTSGKIISSTYEKLSNNERGLLFKSETRFESSGSHNLDMGVQLLLGPEGNWRKPKKFSSFDDAHIGQSKNRSRTGFFQNTTSEENLSVSLHSLCLIQ